MLTVYFEVPCLAASSSACLNLCGAGVLHRLSLARLQIPGFLGQLKSSDQDPLCFARLWQVAFISAIVTLL